MTGRILIVDDLATNRIVLKVRLAAARYDTLIAAGGVEALHLARSERPDLILLDVELPDLDGVEVCRRLRADPATRDIPVVAITATRDRAQRLRALEAGADDVLWKPFDDQLLLARLRSLLRARGLGAADGTPGATAPALAESAEDFRLPPQVTLVCDRVDRAMALRAGLRPHFPGRIGVAAPDVALGGFEGLPPPDAILILTGAPDITLGLRLLSELRARPGTRNAAFLFAVPAADRPEAALALDMGADDLIDADAEPAEIALRLRKAAERKQQDEGRRRSLAAGLRLAATDPLTGLYNRRYALPQLTRIAAEATATGGEFAVMLLDIDRFKAVNDTYGHAAGDHALCTIATRLQGALAPEALLARVGGEEFLVVLPDCDLGRARAEAERLRRLVAEQPVALPQDGPRLTVTLSVGLAVGGGSAASEPARLLDHADRALLASKGAGRNRVHLHRPAA